MIEWIQNAFGWLAQQPARRGGMLIVSVILLAGLFFEVATWVMPLPDGMEQEQPASPIVSDRAGEPLRMIRLGESLFHKPVQLENCGEVFLLATLAAEDKRFHEHQGVDWLGLVRVGKEFVQHGQVMSGGSTITQQLVKNSETTRRPRNIRTKFIEILQARKLERRWDKRKILEAYLNRIDYGNLCRGAGAAARFYFDKSLTELSPAEAALLAGLPNAPSRLNPLKHPDRAKARQQKILLRMHRNGWLAGDALKRAQKEPLTYAAMGRAFAAPHFIDLVLQKREISTDVQSTLDLDLNRFAQRRLQSQIERLKDRRVGDGAVVVIDNPTGDVLALVGSQDFFNRNSGQVNGAWAPRSAGSTFKPFTYLLVLESGATAATVLADVPVDYPTSTGVFSPENFDLRYRGPVNMRHALGNSLNIPAVQALDHAGGAGHLAGRLEKLGLTTLNERGDYYGLGLTIGNAEARLLELSNAYATLGRMGVHRPLRLLKLDPRGHERVFNDEVSWLITDILSDSAARLDAFGAESALEFPFPVACKTGTSSEFRDNWAFGYTPEFTVGVWVGNFDGSPMRNVSGVTGAAPIMNEIMAHLHQTRGTSWFQRPNGLVSRPIGTGSGLQKEGGRPEWFRATHVPRMELKSDRDPVGRFLLGNRYAHWLNTAPERFREQFALAPAKAGEIRILTPQPGTVIYLDPDLPYSSRDLPLRAVGPNPVWKSETLTCVVARPGNYVARLKPGRHELIADCAGQRLRTWVMVEER